MPRRCGTWAALMTTGRRHRPSTLLRGGTGTVFFPPFYTENDLFYQDRHGTNIGKVEGNHVSAGCVAISRTADGLVFTGIT
jgi:hypothetical protein